MSTVIADPVSRIIPLKAGRAYCLPSSYAVDGRVSWHDPEARGYATFNCYLFVGEDGAVLVDTGLTVHRDSVLAQIDELVGPDLPLTIMHLRQGEFDSVCNTIPIVDRFNVTGVHGLVYGGYVWADLLAVENNNEPLQRKLDGLNYDKFMERPTVPVGTSGWELVSSVPALRLLNTFWMYDPESRTMMTSDVFTYLVAEEPTGPWQVDSSDPLPSVRVVKDHLLTTRFWWLAGAKTDYIRKGLDDLFERHEVENIAPSFGSIIRGADAVREHRALLDQCLSELRDAEPLITASR